MIFVKGKYGKFETFQPEKIHRAIKKSASRVFVKLSEDDCKKVSSWVLNKVDTPEISVEVIHNLVEKALRECNFQEVAESYMNYRNWRKKAALILDSVHIKNHQLESSEDKSNANTDSSIVSTKRSIKYQEYSKAEYKEFFLNDEEKLAFEEGFIYIHDIGARYDTYNCCLLNVGRILKGGFTLATIDYTEPKSVDVAIDVLSDIISTVAGNQYGGLTVPQIDEILAPYCQKSYNKFVKEYKELVADIGGEYSEEKADIYACKKIRRDVSQRLQGVEYTFNSVSSSRGDFPFITFTFGHSKDRWAKLVAEEILKVRMGGQGREGKKAPVVFPKLVFLYDNDLHGEGKELEDLFDLAIECNKVSQYPDFLSLDAGYIGEVYHKWGKIVSPMGCRSFLSPMFKNSGAPIPQDENDEFLIYRCNLGVISLNLPMIIQKAKVENKDWKEVLDYYLNITKNLSLKTVEYLKTKKASSNPLAFCEGGFDGGTLDPNDSIASVIKNSTVSIGYWGLNEVGLLWNGKSIVEDQEFPYEVLSYIKEKADKYKQETSVLFSVYGTPGESSIPWGVNKFVEKYGQIEGVTDSGYFTNSFHCCVREDITPIQKMLIEENFWALPTGGRIMYGKVPTLDNTQGIKDMVRLAMTKGLYYGVNQAGDYCTDCGHHFIEEKESDDTICPNCDSSEIIKIRRMNGYLSYTRTKQGKTRFNPMKDKEIKERISM